jgi:hypothetical protein
MLFYQLPAEIGDSIAREYVTLEDISNVSHVAVAPNGKYIAIDADHTLRLYDRQRLLESMEM